MLRSASLILLAILFASGSVCFADSSNSDEVNHVQEHHLQGQKETATPTDEGHISAEENGHSQPGIDGDSQRYLRQQRSMNKPELWFGPRVGRRSEDEDFNGEVGDWLDSELDDSAESRQTSSRQDRAMEHPGHWFGPRIGRRSPASENAVGGVDHTKQRAMEHPGLWFGPRVGRRSLKSEQSSYSLDRSVHNLVPEQRTYTWLQPRFGQTDFEELGKDSQALWEVDDGDYSVKGARGLKSPKVWFGPRFGRDTSDSEVDPDDSVFIFRFKRPWFGARVGRGTDGSVREPDLWFGARHGR